MRLWLLCQTPSYLILCVIQMSSTHIHAGLDALEDTSVFGTVRYMNDLVHAFGNAGLGAVTHTTIFDTVCYMNGLVHAFRGAGLGAATDAIIHSEMRVLVLRQTPSHLISCVI